MGDQEGGEVRGKVSMKKLFSRRKVKKDGTEGKVGLVAAPGGWAGKGLPRLPCFNVSLLPHRADP